MENEIMYDSSIFIAYFRTRDKENTLFERLQRNHEAVFVSAIVKYEVLCGAKDSDLAFWRLIFDDMEILPFDDTIIDTARQIHRQLKRDRCLIDTADILIAATAITNDLPLATLNQNHFKRINGLRLIDVVSEPPPLVPRSTLH
jgi:predicted nucleic acid-binding protein